MKNNSKETPIYLSEIKIYPVKSIRGFSQSQAWVEKQGLAFDRRFMVALDDGSMVTARQYPQLYNVMATLHPEGIYLTYLNHAPLLLRYSYFDMKEVRTHVFKDNFIAYSTTLDANLWFSKVLNVTTQLLFTGEQSNRLRSAIPYNISFADGYPLLIIGQSSLDSLNERSYETFSMDHFRPNLVIRGSNAFDEDGWKRIRIGDVEFEGIKPCTRCVMTTVDPQTTEFNENKEPLMTLSRFRSDEHGNIKFGHNLVALNEGVIRVGDKVEILEKKSREFFIDRSVKKLNLICVEREEVARDFCTFWFQQTKNKKLPHYLPGQNIKVRVNINDKYISRNYTLSSSPSRPERYAISVKRTPNGVVSNWLHDHCIVGSEIFGEEPSGSFYLTEEVDRILLIAAGSGITPILSMLRYLSDNDKINNVILYYQCRTREDIAFKAELEQLKNNHPSLKIIISLSQPDKEWIGQVGRLDYAMLKDIPDLIQRKAFVCGPNDFMKNIKRELVLLGLPEANYYQETFGTIVTPQLEYKSILININGAPFKGDNQQSLLVQAENAGIMMPYNCRAGFCGECKVKLHSGSVIQNDAPALLPQEQENKYVLACCCIPSSDIEIKY